MLKGLFFNHKTEGKGSLRKGLRPGCYLKALQFEGWSWICQGTFPFSNKGQLERGHQSHKKGFIILCAKGHPSWKAGTMLWKLLWHHVETFLVSMRVQRSIRAFLHLQSPSLALTLPPAEAWVMLLNISITVRCFKTLVFFLGTRLYVPILRFFFRDTEAAGWEDREKNVRGKGEGRLPRNMPASRDHLLEWNQMHPTVNESIIKQCHHNGMPDLTLIPSAGCFRWKSDVKS